MSTHDPAGRVGELARLGGFTLLRHLGVPRRRWTRSPPRPPSAVGRRRIRGPRRRSRLPSCTDPSGRNPAMAEDWRVIVDFDDEETARSSPSGSPPSSSLPTSETGWELRVVVSREGPRVFLYADTEERARAALEAVTRHLESEGRNAISSFERWHPVEQDWEDVSVPLPSTDEEIQAEHDRQQRREAAESLERGARMGGPGRAARSRRHGSAGRAPRVPRCPRRQATHVPARRGSERRRGARLPRSSPRRRRRMPEWRSSRAAASFGKSCLAIRSPSSAVSEPERAAPRGRRLSPGAAGRTHDSAAAQDS